MAASHGAPALMRLFRTFDYHRNHQKRRGCEPAARKGGRVPFSARALPCRIWAQYHRYTVGPGGPSQESRNPGRKSATAVAAVTRKGAHWQRGCELRDCHATSTMTSRARIGPTNPSTATSQCKLARNRRRPVTCPSRRRPDALSGHSPAGALA